MLANIGNGPQSGPPLYSCSGPSIYNGTKGCKAARQFVAQPNAAKWLIIVQKCLYPVFGKHPEFGEFTLYMMYIILYR